MQNQLGLMFPQEVTEKLKFTTEKGVAKVTPFELAAAMTLYFEKPFSPVGFHEDLRILYLAQHAAAGIIASGNWRLKAYHAGLNGFAAHHLEITHQQAVDWLDCLLFIYFHRYGKAEEVFTGEMAFGFGAFLSLGDLCRITELPDLLYESERPPLLAHILLMYLDLNEDIPMDQDPIEPGSNGMIEIYFE